MEKSRKLPELLAPAGSFDALTAAIEGGADAVYLGLSAYGARAYAKNFTPEVLTEAARLAHAYGVKVYVTLNTLIYDREREDWLRTAYSAAECGADAIITADLGAALLSKKYIPELELHASTQASGHSAAAARFFASLGFSRMVIARELGQEDIAAICKDSPIEIEQFVHGALCVSVSGQCLMSSQIGGRSGNRGECAQPCRLPWGEKYPLSLKDLSLARHIPSVIAGGSASLKIEGRMKAPEYVFGVTGIYRRLLDENRPATDEEVRELEALFSRGGFTDGYYTGRVSHAMLGVRSEKDKEKTAKVAEFKGITRKIPIEMHAELKLGEPAKLSVKHGDTTAEAVGTVCEAARTAPISEETVLRSLSKLGQTVYSAAKIEVELDDGVMLPISALNELRRAGIAALEEKRAEKTEYSSLPEKLEFAKKSDKKAENVAIFRNFGQIPSEAQGFFDAIFLPLYSYKGETDGVIMPPVIFSSETEKVKNALKNAVSLGAKRVMIENAAQFELVEGLGLELYGGARLNVTNSDTAAFWQGKGVTVTLSPELKLPQARDIGGAALLPVYGRTTLMLTEKCVLSEISPCSKRGCSGKGELVDRMGVKFPVMPLPPTPKDAKERNHRTEIFNSVPTYMADRQDELEKYKISGKVFTFTTETKEQAAEVIENYKNGVKSKEQVRRI